VNKHNTTRVVILVSLVAAGVVGYWLLGDKLTLGYLAEQEVQLRAAQQAQPMRAYGVAFLIYVVATGLSLPVLTGLSLGYGWIFGIVPGIILASFASTAGATVAFLLSRYLFRDFVQSRFRYRVNWLNDHLKRDGVFFLFTLRMLPAIPFTVINSVAGLTSLGVVTFWWVTQLGMLPATCIYVYAGSIVPSLAVLADRGVQAAFTGMQLLKIFLAFGLLAIFPFATRWAVRRMDWTKSLESDEEDTSS